MKDTRRYTLNIRGRLVNVDKPTVMGIVNCTDDSFYTPSRQPDVDSAVARATTMAAEGATIIDIGGCSTRPGSEPVGALTEASRVVDVIRGVRAALPDTLLSVDTFRAEVARQAIEAGADIVNDVSGAPDADMVELISSQRVPYVLTHNRQLPDDADAMTTLATVIAYLQSQLRRLRLAGVSDVIVDPGIGFGKGARQSYDLLAHLEMLRVLGCPVLVGVSRKSLITRSLGITADEALNATTALHAIALEHGADILRVHDVAQAVECVHINNLLSTNTLSNISQ